MKLLSIAFGLTQVATSSLVNTSNAQPQVMCEPCPEFEINCIPCAVPALVLSPVAASTPKKPKSKGLLSMLKKFGKKRASSSTAKVIGKTECSDICMPWMFGCVECYSVPTQAPTVVEKRPIINCVMPCIHPGCFGCEQVYHKPATTSTTTTTTTPAPTRQNILVPVYLKPSCLNPCITGCGPCTEHIKPVVTIQTRTRRTRPGCKPVCTVFMVNCIPC